MIDADTLRSRLDYDPETGEFTWLPTGNPRIDTRLAGKVAGTPRNGYVVIEVGDDKHYAHRFAWLYMTGEWPANQIDHIDRNRSNNRFANLRPATSLQNKWNTSRQARSTSGTKGVTWHKRLKRWRAQIRLAGVSRHLGYFDSTDDAAVAYAAAARVQFGEFASLG